MSYIRVIIPMPEGDGPVNIPGSSPGESWTFRSNGELYLDYSQVGTKADIPANAVMALYCDDSGVWSTVIPPRTGLKIQKNLGGVDPDTVPVVVPT